MCFLCGYLTKIMVYFWLSVEWIWLSKVHSLDM